MNEKQQQLTFDKGITNVPSDALCSDNALEESLGMVYDNGEHRVIQKPVEFMTGSPKILFAHKVHGNVIYIAFSDNNVVWGKNNNGVWDGGASEALLPGVTESDLQVTSVGNTLIIKNDDTINYFLWNADTTKYVDLGNKLPEVDVRFWLQASVTEVSNTLDHDDCLIIESNVPTVKNQKSYNDIVVGLYHKNIKSMYSKKCFAKPFSVRYALELYDGTYTHASAPIMMFPSVQENSFAEYRDTDSIKQIKMHSHGAYLWYKRCDNEKLSKWADIVKDIVVFLSDDVEIYELQDDVEPREAIYEAVWHDGVVRKDGEVYPDITMYYQVLMGIGSPIGSTRNFFPFSRRDEKDIMNDLKNNSLFYRAFSIGTDDTLSNYAASKMDSHTLENLTTQERLEDDYYSHCVMSGDNIMSYNNRLLLADVTRDFFEGFSRFLPYDGNQSNKRDWIIEVEIHTPSGTKKIRKEVKSTTECFGAWYFFYPDPRAKEARFYIKDEDGKYKLVKKLELKEHQGLNGSIWMAEELPKVDPTYTLGIECDEYTKPNPERLYNEIFVSEVNNPFVFKAEGNITVGNGEITGISTLTQAISQGQFGQYPLIVFTSEGIWAASTGNTGLFMAVHPMSREVCNNPKSITQTDGAVFFSSDKGLMVVVGSDVKCVSEQMSGRTSSFKLLVDGVETEQLTSLGNFKEYLASCFIAYDYRDSLLWIFNSKIIPDNTYCYVYSVKSGTFGKYHFDKAITNVVNNYPDYLLQAGTDVYSLLERQDINIDGTPTNTYGTTLITRPLKLEDALALKSIMQIRHIHDMNDEAKLALHIFASNNLKHWVELHSLRGTPWKYYKFQFDFSDMKATDRFAGTMLITQERRTNKMR